MARSRPNAKKFLLADHPLVFLLCAVAALMLLTAGVATLVQQAFHGKNSAESSLETVAEGPVSANDTAPTPDTTTDLETGDTTEDTSCSVVQTPEQFAQLATRILDFEEARLQPDFYENQATMQVHATDNYVVNHLRTAPTSESSDASAILDREQTIIGCYVISDSRVIVQAVNVFSTYSTDSTGALVLVNQFTVEDPFPVRNTGWVLQNGQWYVDSAE